VELPPPPASGFSPELEWLASLPDTKIAAIQLYRQENPRASLREAKEKMKHSPPATSDSNAARQVAGATSDGITALQLPLRHRSRLRCHQMAGTSA